MARGSRCCLRASRKAHHFDATAEATTLHVRLLGGMVMMAIDLRAISGQLGALRDAMHAAGPSGTHLATWVSALEHRASRCSHEWHQRADEMDFPLEQQLRRYMALGADLGTVSQMRALAASGSDIDWDERLANLLEEGNHDE